MIKLIILLGILCDLPYGLANEFPDHIKASIGLVPGRADEGEKGVICDFIREMESVSGTRIEFKVRPFVRSLDYVVNGKASFHFPLIKPEIEYDLPYSFSTVTAYKVEFYLYSNKNNPIDPDQIRQHKIETERTHVDLFPMKIKGSSCILCSLKKVDNGRLDGFIYSVVADKIIEENHLKNLHRSLYRKFDVKYVIAKGSQGGEIDRFLTKYTEIMQNSLDWNKFLPPH